MLRFAIPFLLSHVTVIVSDESSRLLCHFPPNSGGAVSVLSLSLPLDLSGSAGTRLGGDRRSCVVALGPCPMTSYLEKCLPGNRPSWLDWNFQSGFCREQGTVHSNSKVVTEPYPEIKSIQSINHLPRQSIPLSISNVYVCGWTSIYAVYRGQYRADR